MTFSRLRYLLPALLLLAACEDPSNVGLGLIGESGGEPDVISVPVQTFEPAPLRDITGGAILLNQSNPTPRFLAGVVDDPLVGTTTATGYIDFGSVSGISDEFRAGPVTAVDILLRSDYVYGDTTSTVELEIHDIPGTWDARAPVDTTIATGGVVTIASVPANQRDVEISMPQSWIDANSEPLRSTSFTTDFQGIALSGVGGNAIIGFANQAARLRVVSAGDTVEYVPTRSLTTTTVSPLVSEGIIVQDASAAGILVELPDTVANLGPAGVNGVLLTIPADTLLAQSQRPPSFLRPTLAGLRLTGRVRGSDGEFVDFFVADAVLANGAYRWPIGAIPENFFYEIFAGEEVQLELSAPSALYTASPAILKGTDVASDGPAFVLTLTRAGF